jgi:predicted ATPase
VTFVDDAQWTDPHTLGLLGYLLQRQRAERCAHLVVLAVRPEALAAPDRDVELAALTRQAATTRVVLGPIEREATARALEALLGASPASRGARTWLDDFVQAHAGGRPFLVVELLRALAAQGLLARPAPPPQPPVPTRVAEAARGRLAGLSSRARGLALAAAVLGAGGFELLRRAAGLVEDDALAALDELLRSGLLHPADPGDYRLEPGLLRAAVAAEVSAAHREILGRRARALLEAASPARTEPGTGEEPGPVRGHGPRARPRPTDERAGRAA